MKKITKIVGVIFILVLLGVGFYFGFGQLNVGFQGGTALSINRVNFDSNDPNIQGDAFLVTFAQTSLGQSLRGSFSSNYINNRIEGDERVSRGFDLNIFGSDTICRYDINRQAMNEEVLYNLMLLDEGKCGGIYTGCTTRRNTCYSMGGIFVQDYSSWLTASNWACVGETNFVPIGKIEFSREDFNAEIRVTVDGRTYTEKINNRESAGINILDNRIVVDWVGNLGTGQQCPTADEQNIMSAYYNNRWNFVSENRVQSWRTLTSPNPDGVPRNFNSCVRDGWQSGESGSSLINKCISAFNRETDNALRISSFTTSGGTSAVSSGAIDSGSVSINTGRQLSFPVFTMRIQAEMLGVFIPVAEPKIERVVCDDFESGYRGIARVDVKNVGDTSGGARVIVACSPPISVSTPNINTFLEAGQTSSFNFALTGDGSGSISCTAQVREAGTNRITDTRQFTCSLTGVGASQPVDGDRRCTVNGEYEIYSGGRWNVQSPVPHPACEGGEWVRPRQDADWLLIGFLIIAGLGIGVAIFIRLKREGYFDQ